MAVSLLRRLVIVLPLAAALGSCGNEDDSMVDVSVIGDPGSPFVTGPRLPQAAQLLQSATAEGLVGFDEQGRVVPALADRWIVTDDGLSYIFRLRDGNWPDGRDITGETARDTLQQAIGRARGSALALDLSVIEDVRAMAGRVVEIRLNRQSPDFLQLLAQPELGLMRGGRGAGPMVLTRLKRSAMLKPIPPQDRGLPQDEDWEQRARKLRLTAFTAQQAIERFNAGETAVVLGGRLEDFPRLDTLGAARGAIRLDPVAGLFGLMVLNGEGLLGDPANREALAMAIDRDALATMLNVGGWAMTTRLVNPGMTGDNGTVGERWAGQTITERRAAAAARIARWRGSRPAPVLRMAMPQGPGADVLFGRLSEDFKAIGIELRRVGPGENADLRLMDSVARYARPDWFLNQLSCAAARGLCSSAADRLTDRARGEADPAKAADLLAQAEAQLTQTNSFIPLGSPIRWSLVSGTATGFAINRWNIHPLMPLALAPK